MAALEDKIFQLATVAVLNAIYEEYFLGFLYGFRPKRGQRDALDALSVAIGNTPVNWILDAAIKGFFDVIDQQSLIRFLKYRVVTSASSTLWTSGSRPCCTDQLPCKWGISLSVALHHPKDVHFSEISILQRVGYYLLI